MAETKLHKFSFENQRIPKIEPNELTRRLKLIFPCVEQNRKDGDEEIERKHLIKIKTPEPTQSFIWDWKEDKILGMISHGIAVRDRPGDMPGSWYLKDVAETVGEFITLHGCGHPMLFKPSVKEVLSQLPAELFDEEKLAGRKLYFTTNMLNETDFLRTSMLSSTYHIAKTIVYIEKIKE